MVTKVSERQSAAAHAGSSGQLGDLCRRAEIVRADAPIATVPRRFLSGSDALLVVTDDADKVVGLLRPRDLLRAVDLHGASSLRDLTAGDLAGPAMIFHSQESARAASLLMAHERHEAAVVIDGSGAVCGLWTACDALGFADEPSGRSPLNGSELRVRHIAEAVPSVGSETPLSSIVGRLEAAPLGFLVVVDASMRPVGVVTAAHLIGEVAGHGRESLGQLTALDVMAKGVDCMNADAPLEQVAATFAKTDRPFVAVCDGDALMGIVRPERLLAFARRGR